MRTHSRRPVRLAATIVLMAASLPLHAQVTPRRALTLDGAKYIAATAAAEATRLAAGVSIAVVDENRALLYLERLDRTAPASAAAAIEKARTAGVPIVIAGQAVGAIGVSGAKSTRQDDDIAKMAAAIATAAPDAISTGGAPTVGETYFANDRVITAFVKGQPLVETAGYEVHASRRDGPGTAEAHLRDTDIFYILDGRATVVLGGTLVDSKTTAPNELRGTSIDGGIARTLVKGDILIVPEGVPHWFRDVPGPLLYYTVKATSMAPGRAR